MSKNEKQNSEMPSSESDLTGTESNGLANNSAASAVTQEKKTLRDANQKNRQLPLNPNGNSDRNPQNEKPLKRFLRLLSVFPPLYYSAVKAVCKIGSVAVIPVRYAKTVFSRLFAFFRTRTVADNDNNTTANRKPQNSNIGVHSGADNITATKNNKKDVNEDNKIIEDSDEDEDAGFRWLNVGVKVAAATVVVLVLTGGYFGVKSFLGKNKPLTVETSEESSKQTAKTSEKESAKQEVANLQTNINDEVNPAANPQTNTNNGVNPVPNPQTNTNINDGVNSAANPQPVKTSQTASTDPWNIVPPETTVNGFSNPIAPSTTAPPTSPPTTNLAVSPELPFSLESPAAQNEKPNVAPDSLTFPPITTTPPSSPLPPKASETSLATPPNTAIPTPTNTTEPTPTVTEPAAAVADTTPTNTAEPTAAIPNVAAVSDTEAPATAETAQLAPLKMQPSTTDHFSSSTSSVSNISGNQSLAIPKSDGEIQTLPQLSSFSQAYSEQSVTIPEQPETDSLSGEFTKAPTPPEMVTAPITSPAREPVIPAMTTKKEETIPAIPKSGTVQTFAEIADSVGASSPLPEPPPSIPADSVTFAQPAAPPTVLPPPVTPTPYMPPTFAQSTASALPAPNTITNTAIPNTEANINTKTTANNETVVKTNEPVLAIPKDSQRSEAEVPAAPISTAAILPQHRELAKVEPPLGSQLQNQVRKIRNQENSEPKLRFGSDIHAPTGAVRYHPKSTVQNITDLLPSQAMPVDTANPDSNPLVNLLPSGNVQSETADSLPPLETAPKPVTATLNPAYRRSRMQDIPVPVQPENSSSVPDAANNTAVNNTAANNATDNSERRAKVFRRIDAEIKRSPVTAEQYTVQKNDTYMTISDQFFGTSRLFRALAEYNRQKYGTDYKLPEGTVVEIPPVDYLKNNYAEMLTRSGQRPEKNTTASVSIPGVRYIVRDEDTVFRIATNQLRDSSRWQEIIEMNSDKLRSPRDLQSGMEIILPIATATATQSTYGRR
ncbi:MAG: LysM peptidoglycan-binding domain-containing protein [Planctomycetaceae bacterium]|jgi:nucleoid-associated protein YgaU|nr:LysM peptidoglycan-binding domain-containing protein [Planctomycetaceae bacterium]